MSKTRGCVDAVRSAKGNRSPRLAADGLRGEDGFVLPVGTVTLLLADVEGSTRLWEQHGQEMPARIAAANDVVSEVIGAHHGVRPVEQGEGDSFVAAFAKASDAVACALDVQRRLADSPLRYRMGIHAGEAHLRGEGNYAGAFINRTARLRDVGHGGQVLLSGVVADLVVDHLPTGATLEDMGSHRLRDLTRPEQLYQLAHPDLRPTFPPLRSLDSVPHNLPVQLSTFVGRVDELAELSTLVLGARLVTLTGSGGCGKTRLALEVAAACVDSFPNGVWFCDLSALGDADHVPETVARALGLRAPGAASWTRVLTERLTDARTLIVMDNCEHVVGACAALADDLLRHCSRLVVLATSREPLGVAGEVSWRVPSLAAPHTREPTPIDALTSFDAVRLFIDRARLARPNFSVTADNAAAITDICARLDGIPLAIELAAARVRVLGVDRIASGLSDRFRLLGGGARSAMPRQQTLLASVAWSYDLLSEPQRVVLRRLAVFAGPFGLDAAEHVAAADPVGYEDVLEVITQLIDRSLVQTDESAGPVRYRLLETMRQFASDRLVESGEGEAARGRHLEYYEAWLLGSGGLPGDLGEDAALALVDVEHDNLREALAWAVDSSRSAEREAGLRIVGGLWAFWLVRGHYVEGRRWAESMLAGARDASPAARATALLTLAAMADMQNDFATAGAAAQEATAAARVSGNDRLLARSLEKIGWPLGFFDYAGAVAALTESAALARSDADVRAVGPTFSLAYHELLHGDLTAAKQHFDECIAMVEPVADDTLVGAQARCGSALVHAAWAQYDIADPVLDRALEVFRRKGEHYWTMLVLANQTIVAMWRGDAAAARTALDAAAAASERVDSQFTMLVGATGVPVLVLEDRLDEVEAAAAEVLPRLEMWGPRVGAGNQAVVQGAAALARLARGDSGGALSVAEEALGKARAAASVITTPLAVVAVAVVLLGNADEVRAERVTHDALTLCVDQGGTALVPHLLEVLAAVARVQASGLEAARLFGAAAAMRERTGSRATAWGVDVNAELDALRAGMFVADFAKAWDEGAALSTEDAVAYARRGRGERKRPPSGWAGLTPTELRVVGFVAQGLSNPDIAERLFISRRTVASHLTHVFAKLGLRTRAELTAAALRRDRGLDRER